MKKKLSILSVFPIAIPAILVSCQKENTSPYISNFKYEGMPQMNEIDKVGSIFNNTIKIQDSENKEHEISLWDYFGAVEGEVISLADGDTITVKVTKKPNKTANRNLNIEVGETFKVRIPNIDTLEENTSTATESEKSLAKVDHKFASDLLLNKKVRLIAENWSNYSFNRIIANVFFGENFNKNFGIEMLANGYTLARLDDQDFKKFYNKYRLKLLLTDPDIKSLLMPYLAYAINSGYLNKKGFYGEPFNISSPVEFSKKYKNHGQDLIYGSNMILLPKFSPHPQVLTPKNNIYKFFESLKK